MKLRARELIPCVSKFCLDEWQDIWDCCEGIHSIYPTVGIVKHSKNILHYDSVPYGIPLTVKHILVQCVNLRDIREKYFTVSSIADLFKSVANHTVINFIKETHFYHQL